MPTGDRSISVRSTHQLESRMREIRPSGSGEGAVLSRPYLSSSVSFRPLSNLMRSGARSDQFVNDVFKEFLAAASMLHGIRVAQRVFFE